MLIPGVGEISERKFGSREGSTRGAGGVSDRRTFIVKLQIADEDFTENRYPDPRGIVEIYKVPYGSASPWNAFAKALHYQLGQRLGNKTWEVHVGYEVGGVAASPTMEAAWDRWTVSIRGAAGTQTIIEEPTEALESWGIDRPGRLIGTPVFAKGFSSQVGPVPRTFTANLWRTKKDGTIEQYDQPLHMTDARKVRPYTADVQALTYTQTRLFANFNLARVGFIANYYKTVNLFEYLGAKPAHLKFVDFNLDEIPHMIGTPDRPGVPGNSPQLEPGIAYRASLVFLFSAKPFTPLSLVATVQDELGNQSPVTDSEGNKVVDDNWTVAGTNFETLLTIVQGGLVAVPRRQVT